MGKVGGAAIVAALVLAGCGNVRKPDGDIEVSGFDGLARQIEDERVGRSPDQWIEMRNDAGEWERTGLIFGYFNGDYEECVKAIVGLKQANSDREYRCIPAN